jgi:Rrf2 family protein
MKRNTRLSAALHALLHLANQPDPITSETISVWLQTNPVVVRRTMAGLREAGLVVSEKGHGGGWRLACDPAKVTLRDVYAALGEPALFLLESDEPTSGCLVEAAISNVLSDVYREAQAMMVARLDNVTLAELSANLPGTHFHAHIEKRATP